jgi:IS1 family transposase
VATPAGPETPASDLAGAYTQIVGCSSEKGKHHVNVLPFETRLRVLAALVEGNSIRSTERMLGVHRDTIMRLGVTAGEACQALHERLVRDVRCPVIEMDEIWTYVGKKQARMTPEDPDERGDQYVFVSLDATSKLVIAYLVDKRSAQAALALCAETRMRVLGRPQISTDGFKPYIGAIEWAFGSDVDYAMIVKMYTTPGGNLVEAARRYSPGRIREIERQVVMGNPDRSKISTSYVERQNLTMRMSMRRFTRLTNAFSKRLRNLRAAVALHFAYYNFCRVHETLRVTPAMQAGLTDRIWSLGELLAEATGERRAA